MGEHPLRGWGVDVKNLGVTRKGSNFGDLNKILYKKEKSSVKHINSDIRNWGSF